MAEPPKKRGGIRKRTIQHENDEDEPETLSLRCVFASCQSNSAL